MLKVLAALRAQAACRPEKLAVSEGGRQINYGQLDRMTNAVAVAVHDLPTVIAIFAPNGIDWMVAWLGLARAGKTVVTLPPFFSSQQLSHVVNDSGAGHVLCTDDCRSSAEALGKSVSLIADLVELEEGSTFPELDDELAAQSRHIIYTSGTTGAPKGVRLGSAQIDWSAAALRQAVDAVPQDHYLSVLPFALLLEQICGICVPLLAGVPVTIAADVAAALMSGNPSKLIEAVERTQPTISVLVPEFLSAWVAYLQATGGTVPQSLRYVAVGGAPVAPALAEQAVALGIPVHEGYGLSECCSVVAVNRPGGRVAGSVGKPLDGLNVTIVEDEIIVSGPSVMDGYLHAEDIEKTWETGDIGRLDEQGNLTIMGRRDNVLVLSNGRNVSPEWIEAMILADTRIAACEVLGHGEPRTRISLTPSAAGAQWFVSASADEISHLIAELCREAPEYARPHASHIVNQNELASTG